MKGNCLCGKVSFKLSVDTLKIYQCFCTLCQKQSGTESNFATIVPEDKFAFLTGEDEIGVWVKDTGFTSGFCKSCGSPTPNRLRNKAYFWVPVGLLEHEVPGEFTDSKRVLIQNHMVEEYCEFPDQGMDSHIGKISGCVQPQV